MKKEKNNILKKLIFKNLVIKLFILFFVLINIFNISHKSYASSVKTFEIIGENAQYNENIEEGSWKAQIKEDKKIENSDFLNKKEGGLEETKRIYIILIFVFSSLILAIIYKYISRDKFKKFSNKNYEKFKNKDFKKNKRNKRNKFNLNSEEKLF